MHSLWLDIRFGLRTLRKNAGFTAVAVLTLALGIGANTTIFSVVKAVLLPALPYQDPDRLLIVNQRMPNAQPNVFTTPAYLEWKQQDGLASEMAASIPQSFSVTGLQQPERIPGARLSSNFFSVLGVNPILGRTFSQPEDLPGGPKVVVLSYVLWQQRFAHDASVLGRTLTLDGADFTIIGVMPSDFQALSPAQLLWVPMQLSASDASQSARNVHWLTGIVRLEPGMTKQAAQAQLDSIATRIHKQNPNDDAGWGADFFTLNEYNTGNIRPALMVLFGCVGFVLLIACANISNLLLSRAAARRKEIAVRIAIGASRVDIVRQLVTESLLLAAIGGSLALLVAFGGLRVLLHWNPANLPGLDKVALSGAVLYFTIAISVLGGLFFGLTPALQAAKIDSNEALKEGARGSSGKFGAHRAILVVGQISLAFMLLTGAGLLIKNLWILSSVNPGFNPSGLMTLRVSVPQSKFTVPQIPLFYKQVLEKTRALPGVESAAIVRDLPMAGTDPSMPVQVEGHPPEDVSGEPIVTRFRTVSANYFHTMDTPLVTGREFLDSDQADTEPVAVISKSLADEYWPHGGALGQRIMPKLPGARWCTIVGVAADVRHWGPDVPVEPTAYYVYTQVPASFLPLLENSMAVVVRTNGPPASITNSLREAIHSVSPDAPVFAAQTLEHLLDNSGSLRRFNLSLLSIFAGLALTLASIGVYGVVAYTVSQRTREIGIRLAFGAQRRDVLRMILLQSGRLILSGILLGALAGLALSRLIVDLLYGMNARDPLTFVIAAVVIACAAVLASYLPARRATTVDPIVTLRYE